MPIHFNKNETITADTVEEAIRFEQLRRLPPRPRTTTKQRTKKKTRTQGWGGFLELLDGLNNANARKILALVQGTSHGLDSKALATHIQVDAMVVTGTITGIRRKATAVNLNPDEILAKDANGLYQPGRLLAQHGAPIP